MPKLKCSTGIKLSVKELDGRNITLYSDMTYGNLKGLLELDTKFIEIITKRYLFNQKTEKQELIFTESTINTDFIMVIYPMV